MDKLRSFDLRLTKRQVNSYWNVWKNHKMYDDKIAVKQLAFLIYEERIFCVFVCFKFTIDEISQWFINLEKMTKCMLEMRFGKVLDNVGSAILVIRFLLRC